MCSLRGIRIFLSFILVLLNIPTNVRWAKNGITIAGGNGSGNALNQLCHRYGLCADEDQTIIIVDYRNLRIVEWKLGATSGQIVAGGNGLGIRTDQLNFPTDVIIDKQTDSLIICDYKNRRVMRWSRQNGQTSGEVIIENISRAGMTMDDQRFLYISDMEKDEVRRYRMGDIQNIVVVDGNGNGNRLNQLNLPTYLFVDRDQSVYVSDTSNHRVMKWIKCGTEGIIVAGGGGQGSGLIQLNCPQGLFVDSMQTLHVADWENPRVMRWYKEMTQGDVLVGGYGRGG
ncbi:unnamed protein product, partial [Rotaria sp. Silwood2]